MAESNQIRKGSIGAWANKKVIKIIDQMLDKGITIAIDEKGKITGHIGDTVKQVNDDWKAKHPNGHEQPVWPNLTNSA